MGIPRVKLRRMHENQLDVKSKKQKQLPLTTTSLCRAIIINYIDDQELSVVKCSYMATVGQSEVFKEP